MVEDPLEDEYFQEALQVVRAAGVVVREGFSQPRKAADVMTKTSAVDLVTETDRKVEELIIQSISAKFPNHKFIGEESNSEGEKVKFTDDPTWIIDPIDGTTNFVHRMPFVAICLGLTIKKELRAGIIYNPILDHMYTAQKGRGAFKNGDAIHVSGTKELDKSLVICSFGIHNIARFGEGVIELHSGNLSGLARAGIHGHRNFGSAALNMCFVAEGGADAYLEYGVHCWDMAGSGVILREAGGTLIDPTGGEFDLMSRRCLCAGSEELARTLSAKLTHVEYTSEAE